MRVEAQDSLPADFEERVNRTVEGMGFFSREVCLQALSLRKDPDPDDAAERADLGEKMIEYITRDSDWGLLPSVEIVASVIHHGIGGLDQLSTDNKAHLLRTAATTELNFLRNNYMKADIGQAVARLLNMDVPADDPSHRFKNMKDNMSDKIANEFFRLKDILTVLNPDA